MKQSNLSKMTEEPCIVYPWEPCDSNELREKTNPQHTYLDHMSNLKIKSLTSPNVLTSIACGVSTDITKESIEEFCQRGASMVVFDFIGLSQDQCRDMVHEIRQGIFDFSLNKNDNIPYSMALALDLEGIRITTGNVFNAKPDKYLIEIPINSYVYVTNNIEFADKCMDHRIYVNSDRILRLKENDRIFLDYGKIELAVKRVDPEEVYCVVKRGEFLGSKKSVHIPGMPIGTASLTEQDKESIRMGVHLKIDIIMVPGVRNGDFFNQVKKFISLEQGNEIDLYAKIDNTAGLENIDEIISLADGVFLDRPNLSMEVGYDRILLAQKILLSKCNIVGKPSVTNGGYFNSMEYSTVPMISELNDVIATVMDGTDCIFLDVTRRSSFKAHCVQYASAVCQQGEAAMWDQQLHSEICNKTKPNIDPAHVFSIVCVQLSLNCNAAAIIVITTSGLSAKIIARYRPVCPVLAVLRQTRSARKISVWRNLTALQYTNPLETAWSKDVEIQTKFAIQYAKRKGILKHGDLVLHMRCSKKNAGFTNDMSLIFVNEGDHIDGLLDQ